MKLEIKKDKVVRAKLFSTVCFMSLLLTLICYKLGKLDYTWISLTPLIVGFIILLQKEEIRIENGEIKLNNWRSEKISNLDHMNLKRDQVELYFKSGSRLFLHIESMSKENFEALKSYLKNHL